MVDRLGSGGFGEGPRDGGRDAGALGSGEECDRDCVDGVRVMFAAATGVDTLSVGLLGVETVPPVDIRLMEGTPREAAPVAAGLEASRGDLAGTVGFGLGVGFDGPAVAAVSYLPPIPPDPPPKRSFIALTDTGCSSPSTPFSSSCSVVCSAIDPWDLAVLTVSWTGLDDAGASPFLTSPAPPPKRSFIDLTDTEGPSPATPSPFSCCVVGLAAEPSDLAVSTFGETGLDAAAELVTAAPLLWPVEWAETAGGVRGRETDIFGLVGL